MILFRMTLQKCEAHQTTSLGSTKIQNLKNIPSAQLSQEIYLYSSAPSTSPQTPPACSQVELPETPPAI